MGLDFGALPPEINSALMYAGPGSASMLAASSAWNGLAAELNSAAMAYDAQITTLTGEEWLGPASASMAQAAQPYVAWMTATAAQAEQAATQAMAAATAFESAFAATVPPPLVAANRAQLAQLVATNVLGQNNAAIAAAEAQYAEMWAQDATAMYGYAANSATAAKVTPFSTPAQTTNPAGQAVQSAAVTQAVGASAGAAAQSTLSQLQSQVTGLLGQLASPTTLSADLGLTPTGSLLTGLTFPSNSMLGSMLSGIGGSSTLNPQWAITAFRNLAGPLYNIEGMPYFATGMANTMLSLQKGLTPAAAAAAAAKPSLGGVAGLSGGGGIGGGIGGAGVAAGLGQAASVGKLSVPAAWAEAGPALSHAATPLPITITSAAPEAGGPGNLLGGMPLAGATAGRNASGPRYGIRPTVMARPPFAG
jgi:PPE-repeat protein